MHTQQKLHTLVIKSKVSSHVLKQNPTPQGIIAKSLNIPVGTVNKITKSDLKLIKSRNHDVHRPMQKHAVVRKRLLRKAT